MSVVVFLREITGMTRRPWALALALGPLALFSGLLLVRWPSDGQIDLAGERATEVFRLFTYAVGAAVLLLAPAFPAASIVEERRRGTLGLLLNAPMSGGAIFGAKLAAAIAYTLLPLVMSLPAAAACYTLGAIDFQRQIVPLYGVLLLCALQSAVIGLAVSCRAASVVSAMRTTYILMLVVAIGSQLPAWWLVRSGDAGSLVAGWTRSLSPLPALLEIVGQADRWGDAGSAQLGAPWRYGVVVVVTSLVLASATIRQLAPQLLERSRSAGIITEDRGATAQRWRRILFLVDPQRRARGIPDGLNPVLAKEFRARRFGRSSWMLRMVALCAIASLGATFAATTGAVRWSTESIAGAMVQLQVALILVVTPSLASGLISDELESGGWSLLRMTPLSPRQIITGKLLSAAWTTLLLLMATLPGYVVIMVIKPVMTRQVLAVIFTLAMTAAMTIALCAALSSWHRRTAHATIASYALLMILIGGTFAIWAGRDAPFGPAIVERALMLNPAAAALAIIEAPGFAQYRLIPQSWLFVVVVIGVSLVVLAQRTHKLSLPD